VVFDPVSGGWSDTGSLNTPRELHTATLLPNGNVLVAGGESGNVLQSTELYNPATGKWTTVAFMRDAREDHTATLLPNGKVLVTGGDNLSPFPNYLSSAEVYDPILKSWSQIASMSSPRTYHTATLLPNGKVLVAGGYTGGSNFLGSAETYDPSIPTASWKPAGTMTTTRIGHAATLLEDGHVLLTGGHNAITLASAEVFEVGLSFSNSWQPQVTSVTPSLDLGGVVTMTGAQFRGVSQGSYGDSQDSSTDYPLVQLRSIESGRITFLPSTEWETNSFVSASVWNFPPGYALATLFVNGIPGTSSVVSVSVPVATDILLNNPNRNTNSSFQFSFTNTPGAVFGVLATTNVALPLSNWTALGGVTELAPGQFQFVDSQATADQRFYRVRSL
jgi:hypothetical protein